MQREVITWFETNGRDLPWRTPDFSPWGALVSEFMLQQTPVARVVPKLAAWLERWPTPSALAASASGEAVRAWDTLGYPRRALWLHACAVEITQRFDGNVPSTVDDLLTPPGVGPYTARAVAVFAFGAHEPVVDTNIRRVIARHQHGNSDQDHPNTARDLADMAALLPEPALSPRFNQAVMELGALVCTARAPRCIECPIASSCAWAAAGHPDTGARGVPKQARYAGSDRAARGAILRVLRASAHEVSAAQIVDCWPDEPQRDRALASLLDDGLVVLTAVDVFALPE